MARIVRFHQTGGREVLKIEHIDAPPLAMSDVRTAVKALGLNRANRAEAMFQPDFSARRGYEAARTVEAIGRGVQGHRIGDAVSTISAFSQNQYGVYGDMAIVPAFGYLACEA